jgi:hypothetical protein
MLISNTEVDRMIDKCALHNEYYSTCTACDQLRIADLEVENERLKMDLQHIAEGLTPTRDELLSAYHVLTGVIHAHTADTEAP